MSLYGLVKSVLSGDCIVVRGRAVNNGPPPERTLVVADVIAPKLARKDGSGDEPWAWTSREITRKLLLGKEIAFTVIERSGATPASAGQQAREPSRMFLGGPNGPNIAHLLVSAGAVKVRDNVRDNNSNPSSQTNDSSSSSPLSDSNDIRKLQQVAIDAHIGIWQLQDKPEKIRSIKWEVENLKALVDQAKGKPIDAIVERVRDGSTLQVLLLPTFQYATIMISGIKSPTYRKDVPGQQDLIEPFGAEAKYFTEVRLLQQEVKVILEGFLNKNFYGSILFPKGNIAESLLKEGFAKVSDLSITMVTNGPMALREAEKVAKEKKLRIWHEYVARENSKSEFVGKVTKIVNSETIQITLHNGDERKITFSSVKSPKGKEPKEVFYQAEGKEFLRKHLIGRKVTVHVDYIKPAEGEYEQRTCATVKLGDRNIAEELVAAGLATAVKHKQDDENRSSFYDLLKIAEENAIKQKKGIHSSEETPTVNILDISESLSKAKQYLPRLIRQGKIHAIVEHVFSGSRLKVAVLKENFRATFILSGIYCGRVSKDSSEPYANEAFNFTTQHCLQHDVEVEFESVDKNGSFIGNVFLFENENESKQEQQQSSGKTGKGKGKAVEGSSNSSESGLSGLESGLESRFIPGSASSNLAVLLVENGFATIHASSADGNHHANALYTAETRAKQKGINIWQNYKEKLEEAPKVSQTEKGSEFVTILITEVLSDGQFYGQIITENIKSLENLMREFSIYHRSSQQNPEFVPKKGELVSAQFKADNQWYRARVLKLNQNSTAEVLYVDYGNTEIIPLSRLRILPSSFTTLQPQAHLFNLAFINWPKDDDYLSESKALFKQLTQGKKLACEIISKVEKATNVVLFDSEIASREVQESINSQLIQNGLALVNRKTDRKMQTHINGLLESQSLAQKQRANIWRYGDITEDDDSEFASKRKK